MLTLPQLADYTDPEDPSFKATVYADDVDPTCFYAIPSRPTILRNALDEPVFKLVVYGFSNDQLLEDEELPLGGGYLSLDVTLAIEGAHRDRLLAHLQQFVPPATPDQPPRPARLALPEFTDGEVRFLTVQDPNLVVSAASADDPKTPSKTGEPVRGYLAVGKPSLMAGMVAGLTATLTEKGAVFFEKTLVGENGKPIDGLAPIRVEYHLKFWARLPQVHVRAHAEVESTRTEFASVWHDFEERGCDTNYVSTTEHYWDVVEASQAVDIEMDFGTLAADDPGRAEMRQFVMGELTKWLQKNILELTPHDDPAFADMEDIYSSHDDVYRFRSDFSSTASDFHLELTERSIGEKQLFPQGNLQPLFGDLAPEEMVKFVQKIRLGDPFFEKVTVEPRVGVDWKAGLIGSVVLEVDYRGDVRTFTFSEADDTREKVIFDRLDGDRRYLYRYTVNYRADGRGRAFKSEWLTSSARELDVDIPETGRIKVDVNLGTMRFGTVVDEARVEFTYSDPSLGPAGVTGTRTYDEKSSPRDSWVEEIFAAATGKVSAKVTWVLVDGDEIVEDLAIGENREVTLNAPALPTIDASVVVRNVDAVELIVLDLRNVGGNADDSDIVTFEVRPSGSERTVVRDWTKRVKAGAARKWQYRYMIVPKGTSEPSRRGPGKLEHGAWSPPLESGETAELVPELPLATVRKTIRFSGATVDFDRAIAVNVVAHHESADGAIVEHFDETIESKGALTWTFDVHKKDLDAFSFTWNATYFTAAGEAFDATGTSDGSFLSLPAWPAA